ncbi:hypothetical protein DFH06DRAFT_1222859 [Mycena polygramma]|nr:hypothetical protein DFH06DRAFT_1222859 [Mycena polygramma]
MNEIYANHVCGTEFFPRKLWSAGREISRLFLTGDRWNVPFIRVRDPSPISRLPYDVLAEIFMWGLCANGFLSLNHRSRLPLEPLTLSHVSSRWRDAALSTPALWSTIWMDRPREAHIPMVELWIERSRQCPLILYLRQTPPPLPGQQPSPFVDPNEYELTDKLLLILGYHLHRWKRVTFLFQYETQRALLNLPEIPTAAPLLKHVHMSARGWDADSKLAVERTMYSYASVDSVVVHASVAQDFLRWERLTELDASQLSCPVDSHLNVLKHCPSLRRAELRVTQNRADAPFIRPTVRSRAPQLSSLTIHAETIDLAVFFENLILPKLEGLVLKYTSAPRRSNDPLALQHMFLRSLCALQRFSLRDVTGNKDDRFHLAFLRVPQMASLLELYMQVDMSDKIVSFLTLGSGEPEDVRPRMLPKLQTLSLQDMHGDHVDDRELYCMVVSRLPAPPPDPRLPAPGPDRNGRYPSPLRRVYFHLRVKGHSDSPVLPLLLERCRERIDLRIYLDDCEDRNVKVGWYTSPPIPGGYLTEG